MIARGGDSKCSVRHCSASTTPERVKGFVMVLEICLYGYVCTCVDLCLNMIWSYVSKDNVHIMNLCTVRIQLIQTTLSKLDLSLSLLVRMSNILWSYVIRCARPSVCPSVLRSRNVAHFPQNFQPFFTPAIHILTSTILYHFQWLWPWLGVTRSGESKACWLRFLYNLLTDQDEISLVVKKLKLNI